MLIKWNFSNLRTYSLAKKGLFRCYYILTLQSSYSRIVLLWVILNFVIEIVYSLSWDFHFTLFFKKVSFYYKIERKFKNQKETISRITYIDNDCKMNEINSLTLPCWPNEESIARIEKYAMNKSKPFMVDVNNFTSRIFDKLGNSSFKIIKKLIWNNWLDFNV